MAVRLQLGAKEAHRRLDASARFAREELGEGHAIELIGGRRGHVYVAQHKRAAAGSSAETALRVASDGRYVFAARLETNWAG